jgi:hypothetical protein
MLKINNHFSRSERKGRQKGSAPEREGFLQQGHKTQDSRGSDCAPAHAERFISASNSKSFFPTAFLG